jgi:hypothetical protein
MTFDELNSYYRRKVGRDSAFVVDTRNGLVDPGIEPRWRPDFPLPPRPPKRPADRSVLYYMIRSVICTVDTASLSQWLKRLMRDVGHPSPPIAESVQQHRYSSGPSMACSRVKFTFHLLPPTLMFDLWVLLNVVETITNSSCCWVWYVAVQ